MVCPSRSWLISLCGQGRERFGGFRETLRYSAGLGWAELIPCLVDWKWSADSKTLALCAEKQAKSQTAVGECRRYLAACILDRIKKERTFK